MRGLERFLAGGWGDKAALIGWTSEDLYRVPPLWSRIDLTGAALLVGYRRVTAVTADNIVIEFAVGIAAQISPDRPGAPGMTFPLFPLFRCFQGWV